MCFIEKRCWRYELQKIHLAFRNRGKLPGKGLLRIFLCLLNAEARPLAAGVVLETPQSIRDPGAG